jgi:hypothetical protein
MSAMAAKSAAPNILFGVLQKTRSCKGEGTRREKKMDLVAVPGAERVGRAVQRLARMSLLEKNTGHFEVVCYDREAITVCDQCRRVVGKQTLCLTRTADGVKKSFSFIDVHRLRNHKLDERCVWLAKTWSEFLGLAMAESDDKLWRILGLSL